MALLLFEYGLVDNSKENILKLLDLLHEKSWKIKALEESISDDLQS